MIWHYNNLLLILLLYFLLSCGPQEHIEVEVSSGITPTISWDWGRVTLLFIADITNDENRIRIWEIHGRNWRNNISSPIVYGIIPDTLEIVADIAINDSTEKLIPGHKYIAEVMCGPAVGSCEFIASEN